MNRSACFIALIAIATLADASPWTYRGTLNDGGKPANGSYDLRLTLVSESAGQPITQPITLFNIKVKDGNFAADVDFGLPLDHAPPMKLKTEVAQGGSAFSGIGEPTRFDPKAALAGLCWDTTGNVVAAGEFLGSTNNVPVEIKANNRRAARFEATGSANESRVVLGSPANVATGNGATIGGGGSSAMTCGAGSASCANQTDETFATISGGAGNAIVGPWSVIGGGDSNATQGSYTSIGGGSRNSIGLTASYATIAGGSSNSASGQYASVSGGTGNGAVGDWSIAAGGQSNQAQSSHSVVSGGSGNYAVGSASAVAGGLFNYATGSRGIVAGGESGTASGASSFVAGGYFNCAGGRSSFAGGRRARIRPGTSSGAAGEGCIGVTASGTVDGDGGSFVWADTQDIDLVTTGPNQFLARAAGGVMFNTAALSSSNDDMVIGARPSGSGGDADADMVWKSRAAKIGTMYLSDTGGGFTITVPNLGAGVSRLSVQGGSGGSASLSNGGMWTNASSRSFKQGFKAIDPLQILDKVVAMPITTWAYKQSIEGNHIGPMAEDFKAAFDLAGDGKSIGTADADGVALAAIQGLNQKLENENAALRAQMAALQQAVKALQQR
ncbi:MAG: hypothetical protein SGI99_14555 [Pseudomonadota bacterium]|nr:hypothetical protein [Pseudomonadota bacterium]